MLEAAPPALEMTSDWSWAVEGPLDLDAMNRAGAAALGEHDFRSFCRRPDGTSPDLALTRRVLELSWERLEDEWTLAPGGADALRLWIRARSFCHQMVRSLTSTMVAVGQGRLDESTSPSDWPRHAARACRPRRRRPGWLWSPWATTTPPKRAARVASVVR